jgi:hypothetical protein
MVEMFVDIGLSVVPRNYLEPRRHKKTSDRSLVLLGKGGKGKG